MANLPPFTPEDPNHWLKLCDAHFSLKNIDSPREKIYYILTSLPYELQRELDAALSYTTDAEYTEFKTLGLSATALPAQKRINQLISSEELGDQKPSVFLRHLKSLAGSQADNEEFIKPLFLKRLPSSISQILASMPQSNVDELARSADAIIHYRSESIGNISAFGANQGHEPNRAMVEQLSLLRATVANLSEQLKDVTRRLQNLETDAGRTRGRSVNKFRSHSRTNRSSGMCFYHEKFGTRANRCQKPCNFTDNPK